MLNTKNQKPVNQLDEKSGSYEEMSSRFFKASPL
jgi:hypothetical protein